MPLLVLSVDGSDCGRHGRSVALRRAGFTVVAAGDGADALSLALDAQPSLILLNAHAAGAFALARRLKADGRTMHIPVLCIAEMDPGEERLRRSRNLESVGVLAAGVAHDFNNLLMNILGNASLAREILPPDSAAAGLLEGIVKAGEQAAHLTRQMLAYSGKGRFLVEAVNLSDLVAETVALMRPSIPENIALFLRLRADLPSIPADHGQMRQIVANLIVNATEATGGGGERALHPAPPGSGGAGAGPLRPPGGPRRRMRHGRRHQNQNLRPVLLDEIHRARPGTGGRGRHRARAQGGDRGGQRSRQRRLLYSAAPRGVDRIRSPCCAIATDSTRPSSFRRRTAASGSWASKMR
jgi:CheY-like chemotaxis protein